MRKAVKEILSDEQGALSTIRLIAVLVVAVILSILIAHNIASLCYHKGFVDMPVNCLAALGLVISGKIVQNFTEKKNENLTPPSRPHPALSLKRRG